MSFIEELKRRNVFRVGIAYLVGSWILVQVADILFEAIGTPEWAMQTLLVFLGLGFFVALFFAWAFEMTPEGVRRESEVDRSKSITSQTGRKLDFAIIGLMALALGYFIWESRFADRVEDRGQSALTDSKSTLTPSAEQGKASIQDASTEPAISRQSVAVLPFTNRSRNAEDDPFVEGVHDDLLTNLARIADLKVISRTSVLRYKDTQLPIPEIARELGVATVMEGAVQRAGNTVRINVQLIDANSDEHLWAEIFDRELTAENLFAIQSEISQKIAAALQATLTDAERERINTMPTDNLAAYDAFVRGRQLMATREVGKLEEATRAFGEAVELDPEFALAWVGVADSHDLLNNYGTLDFNEALAIREDAVNRAMALDPELGEAWTSMAQLLSDQRKPEEAEAAFQKATEFSPGYATAWHWYSLLIRGQALRAPEAADLARKAFELDPRSPILGVNLGGAYQNMGLYSRAERVLLDVLAMEPGFPNAMSQLAALYRSMGRFDKAMTYVRKAAEMNPGSPNYLNQQAFIYLQLGEVEKAEMILQKLEDMDPGSIGNGFVQMWVNLVRGNHEGAMETARWLVPKIERVNGAYYFMGFLEATNGQPQLTREYFIRSNPGWADEAQWPNMLERYEALGCAYAWALLATGEQEGGQKMLTMTTKYLSQDLPAADEHWDQYNVENCHLVAGDTEAALAVLQTRLDHNHLGFWRAATQLPWFESLRYDPRYNAILDEHDRRIAEQRKVIEQMNLETGP